MNIALLLFLFLTLLGYSEITSACGIFCDRAGDGVNSMIAMGLLALGIFCFGWRMLSKPELPKDDENKKQI